MYFKKIDNSPIENCPLHEHTMYFSNVDNGWCCDCPKKIGGCRRRIFKEYQSYLIPRFRCKECDFDLCDLCAQMQTKSFNHPWHHHPLYLSYIENGWCCDGTLRKGGCKGFMMEYYQSGQSMRFRCYICDYDLCIYCMKEGLPDEELREENLVNDFKVEENNSVDFSNINYDEMMKKIDKSPPLEPFQVSEDEKKEIKEKNINEEIKLNHLPVFDKKIESGLCKICYDRPKNVALVHVEKKTSHFICCRECSTQLKECPICREPIDFVTKPIFIR